MRETIINAIEDVVCVRPQEHERMIDVMLDDADFYETVDECEKSLDIEIDISGMGITDFETVGDFVDWILTFVNE